MNPKASLEILHHASIKKVQITDKYLLSFTVSGSLTVLDIACQHNVPETCEHRSTLGVGKMWNVWDIDCCGDVVVTANADGVVRLWDIKTRTQCLKLVGHTDGLHTILMPNAHTVISGSKDASIIVWDVPSGQRRHTLTGHGDTVICLELHDNVLVSGSYDGTARIWNMQSGQCLHTLAGNTRYVSMLGFNSDYSLLATGASGGDMKIWDISTGTCIATCQGHSKVPTQFWDEGKDLLVSSAADGTIRTWDWSTGELVRTLNAHDDAVRGVHWTDRSIVSAGMDGRVQVWDRETQGSRFELRDRARCVWNLANKGNLMAIAVCPEQGRHVIELWDTSSLDDCL